MSNLRDPRNMPVVKKNTAEPFLGFNYVKVERKYLSKDEGSETGSGGEDGGASEASGASSDGAGRAVGASAAARLLALLFSSVNMSSESTYVWLPPETGGLGAPVPAGGAGLLSVGQGMAMVEYSTEVRTVV